MTNERLRHKIEEIIAECAPVEWFDDPHVDGGFPRCCELRDAIIATIAGMIETYEGVA